MSEEFMDKYNALNQESKTEDTIPAESAHTEQPADSEQSIRQTEHTENREVSFVSEAEKIDSPQPEKTADSVEKMAQQSEQDITPADRVFTTPYTSGYTAYRQPNYSHPSQNQNGYYHQSYVNSRPQQSGGAYTGAYHRTAEQQNPSAQSNPYSSTAPRQNQTAQSNPYSRPSYQPQRAQQPKAKIGAGAIAIILAVCIIVSGFAGFGGSMLASYLKNGNTKNAGDTMIIHQVEATDVSVDSDKLVDKTTEQITEEVADSVVEITTEVMQTSSF